MLGVLECDILSCQNEKRWGGLEKRRTSRKSKSPFYPTLISAAKARPPQAGQHSANNADVRPSLEARDPRGAAQYKPGRKAAGTEVRHHGTPMTAPVRRTNAPEHDRGRVVTRMGTGHAAGIPPDTGQGPLQATPEPRAIVGLRHPNWSRPQIAFPCTRAPRVCSVWKKK